MLKLIVVAVVFAASSPTLAENWMAEPINTNAEGKRAVPLIDRDGIVRTNPTKPFVVHAILYEQPRERIAQRVWVTQFDCAARTFRIISEETRDIDGKSIDTTFLNSQNSRPISITPNSIHEDFLAAACDGRWVPRLRAMGKLSIAELRKALFSKP